jgi:hypothetical protein
MTDPEAVPTDASAVDVPMPEAIPAPEDLGTPSVSIAIDFFPAENNIRIVTNEGVDPLLVFQLLNQCTQGQLNGLTQEMVALRKQVAEQQAGSKLVIAGPGDVQGLAANLREFRRGGK